ncbi:MAG: isochorismatase family cysteine hydrolase [Acidimicrobiia bacterium]
MNGTTALVVVDVQHDFLARPGLVPAAEVLVERVAGLVAAFRARGAPVVHVQTCTRVDGTDAMPHWRDRGVAACVEGTPGAQSPAGIAPEPGELIARKQHYRGFVDPEIVPALRERGVTSVVVCGLYTHADARDSARRVRGRVRIVGGGRCRRHPRTVHGLLTREWLAACRAVREQRRSSARSTAGAARCVVRAPRPLRHRSHPCRGAGPRRGQCVLRRRQAHDARQ